MQQFLVSTIWLADSFSLKDKVVYAGIEAAGDFGERLYIQGEQKLSLSLARNLLLISDGARWISDIVGADYLKATYQLDWWHYEKKLMGALPGELKLRLLRYDRKDWKAYWRSRIN